MSTSTCKPRIGLALAGGGPLGAFYEIGALCALEDSIEGLDLTQCNSFIGVSAGAVLAANIANDMSSRQLCAAFVQNSAEPPDSLDSKMLLRPAWDEYRLRLSKLPGLLLQAGWQTLVLRRPWIRSLHALGRVIPSGFFSGDAVAARLHDVFSAPGRTDDFRKLKGRLVVVATDLDTGEAIPFGMPGWDHIPISRAVQASGALPGLYPPVQLEGRYFADGALKRTMHASVLLEEGLDLLLCLNPMVPFVSAHARGMGKVPADKVAGSYVHRLVDGGLLWVLSQSVRAMIHSRMQLGFKAYARSYPETDILLFEPEPNDAEVFFSNTLGYSRRRHIAEHAYQATRKQLRQRTSTLQRQLQKHGLRLRSERLQDTERYLLEVQTQGRLARSMSLLDRSLRQLEAQAL